MNMISEILAIPLIALSVYLFIYLYDKTAVDIFRDKLFEIRRSLFLLAANNRDLFDNKAYRFFENILNTTLNFADKFTLFYFIMDSIIRKEYYAKKNTKDNFNADDMFKTYTKKIKDTEVKETFTTLMKKFIITFSCFIIFRNFFFSIFFICFLLVGILLKLFEKITNKTFDKIRNFILKLTKTINRRLMSNSQFAFYTKN